MRRSGSWGSVPGVVATVVATLATTGLVVISAQSMFYEWWRAFPGPLEYLLPGLACLVFCLLALRWPRAGAVVLLAATMLAALVWVVGQAGRSGVTTSVLISALVMVGLAAALAGLFLLEARHRRRAAAEGVQPSSRWLARHYRTMLVAGVPLLALALISLQELPRVLSRLDDGERGARLVEGGGVRLVWAPEGPGWSEPAADGELPSWQMLATHGGAVEGKGPTGLCAHLSEDGTGLLATPVGIWRLPEAGEIVRSLTVGGENAGCTWDGQSIQVECRTSPDKETPLWAPDRRAIYYWAAGEHDPDTAYAVNYDGHVNRLPKSWRGPGVGYRCVKAPAPSAEEIVARCAEAMGGMERIGSIRTLRVAALYPDHGDRPLISEIRRPNLIRSRVTVFDGQRAALLERTGRGGEKLPAELVPEEEAKDFEVDVAWTYPAFFEYPAQYRGVEMIDGKESHVLVVELPLGARMTYFVDSESFLVARAAADVVMHGEAYHMERGFSDYRPTDGVLFPRSFSYPGRQGETQHGTIAGIEVNIPFADDHFQIPPDAR